METMPTVPFSARIDSDIKSRLKQEAERENRSEAFVAQVALKQYLDACEYKRQAIDVALNQADEGRFISQEAMGAWVDSWGTNKELPKPRTDVKIKK